MTSPETRRMARVGGFDLLHRAALYLLLWIVLIGAAPVDLAIGVVTAALAAWVSLRLWPPESLRLRPLAVLGLLPHFLWQSVIAGVDVARRACSPRMRLTPGFITYRPRFARGPARNTFTAYTSLLPGTVPCGDEDGAVIYHCLDVGQPIAEQLAAEEAHLARCLAQGTEHDG